MQKSQIIPSPFSPVVTDDSREFWDGCAQGVLKVQRCTKCGKVRMPASMFCPECLSGEYEWIESSGKGIIYSYIVFNKAFSKLLEDRLPYVVAEIDLAEGFRLLTNIVDCDIEAVQCGAEVQVQFSPNEYGMMIPYFRIL